MTNRALLLLLALAGLFNVARAAAQSSSCAGSATPVLLLGTWHMDNPGKDMLNLKTDDVLVPRRQKEIEELVNRLAKFRPTRVLIEAPYGDPSSRTLMPITSRASTSSVAMNASRWPSAWPGG
jgi:hypothetical protein